MLLTAVVDALFDKEGGREGNAYSLGGYRVERWGVMVIGDGDRGIYLRPCRALC